MLRGPEKPNAFKESLNPTKQDFAGMVHENLLTNFPITVHDVDIANLGSDLANLRGKTTRAPDHV
jgi:hypothetical protein